MIKWLRESLSSNQWKTKVEEHAAIITSTDLYYELDIFMNGELEHNVYCSSLDEAKEMFQEYLEDAEKYLVSREEYFYMCQNLKFPWISEPTSTFAEQEKLAKVEEEVHLLGMGNKIKSKIYYDFVAASIGKIKEPKWRDYMNLEIASVPVKCNKCQKYILPGDMMYVEEKEKKSIGSKGQLFYHEECKK